ncbi:MAG TPA: hypothetical protein DEF39_03515 [Hungateiclostridium thermocellum]|uniref:hypothetical protein n=1 Tax=Acetivibrio thermocellus TaxID=1515 RepID=UPI00003C90CA|nr:hypothetical protein [Acetivibrio thermocellus]HBW26338.1 hypothetical protein [Acetivibrio thermocellus]
MDLHSDLFDVIYADDKFVAVGGGGIIITSHNGINCTKIEAEIKSGILKIHWNEKQYLGITRNSLIVSSDGKTGMNYPRTQQKWHPLHTEITIM